MHLSVPICASVPILIRTSQPRWILHLHHCQLVQHVAGSCVTSVALICTDAFHLYLSVPSPPSFPVVIRTSRTAKLDHLSVPTLFICTICTYTALSPNYNSYLTQAGLATLMVFLNKVKIFNMFIATTICYPRINFYF